MIQTRAFRLTDWNFLPIWGLVHVELFIGFEFEGEECISIYTVTSLVEKRTLSLGSTYYEAISLGIDIELWVIKHVSCIPHLTQSKIFRSLIVPFGIFSIFSNFYWGCHRQVRVFWKKNETIFLFNFIKGWVWNLISVKH